MQVLAVLSGTAALNETQTKRDNAFTSGQALQTENVPDLHFHSIQFII